MNLLTMMIAVRTKLTDSYLSGQLWGSSLYAGRMLGKSVAVGDLPPGRVLAVSCGSSVGSDTVQWMCPCGVRYIPHTVGPAGENE